MAEKNLAIPAKEGKLPEVEVQVMPGEYGPTLFGELSRARALIGILKGIVHHSSHPIDFEITTMLTAIQDRIEGAQHLHGREGAA